MGWPLIQPRTALMSIMQSGVVPRSSASLVFVLGEKYQENCEQNREGVVGADRNPEEFGDAALPNQVHQIRRGRSYLPTHAGDDKVPAVIQVAVDHVIDQSEDRNQEPPA